MKKWQSILLWGVWVLVGLVIILGSRKYSHSFYFQDETDHVAVGAVMLEQGKKLYDDIITIHQPLPVIIGGVLAQFTNRNTMFSFISQLRFLMSIIWFISGCFLTFRFRWLGLLASSAAGLFSYHYFGFYVLPEALAFPAVGFMVLSISEKLFTIPIKPRWWSEKIDWFILGLCCFYLIFNLLPTAPFIVIATLTCLYSYRQKLIEVAIWISTGFLLPTLAMFFFINPFSWWQQTVMNLINYWFPNNPRIYGLNDILAIFFYPFISHWWIVAAAMIAPIIYLAWRRQWKQAIKLLSLYGVVCMLHIRPSTPNAVFWGGFHSLPYLIGLGCWIFSGWFLLLIKSRHLLLKIFGGFLLMMWIGQTGSWLVAKNERQTNYEIQYLPQQATVNVLNILKEEGDSLFTGPDGRGYINLLTNLPFADKQNFHLPWAWQSPYLRQDFFEVFNSHPPTFIYWENCFDENSYCQAVTQYLSNDYVVLIEPGGNSSQLYVRKSKAENYTTQKWQKYQETLWQVPNMATN